MDKTIQIFIKIYVLIFLLIYLILFSNKFVIDAKAANIDMEDAVAVEEGETDVIFNSTSEGRDYSKWYTFTPNTDGYYTLELHNPLYINDMYDTYIHLYSSYVNARNLAHDRYKGFGKDKDKIFLNYKMNAGQKYYFGIGVSAYYEETQNMSLIIKKNDSPVPEISFKEDTLFYEYNKEGEIHDIILEEKGAVSCVSTDNNVVKVRGCYPDYISIEIIGSGTAELLAEDEGGVIRSCKVLVKTPEIVVDEKNLTYWLEDEEGRVSVSSGYKLSYNNSNESVIKITNVDDYGCKFRVVGLGKATITITDCDGKKESAEIIVRTSEFALDRSSIIFDDYDAVYDFQKLRVITDRFNRISSISTSDSKVVTVEKDEDNGYEATVYPKGPGEAIISTKDQYGQTVFVKVTVTQKYIDERKYLSELWNCNVYDITYGETSIYCESTLEVDVYTIINGKKYVGLVDENGNYIIDNIPILSAGTKIEVFFQKGLAKYSEIINVDRKWGGDLKASVKEQNYTGKALKPEVLVKYDNTRLVKGVDYTVKYSNNKTVGKGKITISFIGNYKGAKAVYFKINPPKTTINKLFSQNGTMVVTWKRQTKQIDGYQIEYSTNKNFKGGKKSLFIKTKKTNQKVIGRIKRKQYYVRIRTYKKVGNSKYFSEWSKVKTIKNY